MAASSSSGLGKISKGPQVFISFRGKKIRNGFIAHLRDALERADINVFVDQEVQLGTNLQNLFVRIEQSKVALVIFSKKYTTSVWCLDELAKIKECMDKASLIGIPIFYKLKISVVRNLEGCFGDNFRKTKRNNKHDLVRTQNWEEAITSVSQTVGLMKLKKKSDHSQREFIETLVKKVKSLLDEIAMGENVNLKRQEVYSECSMIYARNIDITNSKNPENWTWGSVYEPPKQATIEIATMTEVYWMDISGNFHTRKLTPEIKYEVVFVVKLKESASGWEEPVNLIMKLVMHDKSEIVQEKTTYLDDCIGDEWVDIKVGDFVAPPKEARGRIFFTMSQYNDNVRKTGLVVKGVAIRALN